MSVHTTHISSSHALPQRREAATPSAQSEHTPQQHGKVHRNVRRNILNTNEVRQERPQQNHDGGHLRPPRAINIGDVHVVQEEAPPSRRQAQVAPRVERNERIHKEANHRLKVLKSNKFQDPIFYKNFKNDMMMKMCANLNLMMSVAIDVKSLILLLV